MKQYPYRLHVALDGNGINGFEGMAGVCVFLYDPHDGSYAYKVKYFDGIAAGHAVSVNPGGTVGFLGNAGQHLLFYDPGTLEELDRVSTLRFEPNDTTIRGSTHLIWLDDMQFITAIGDYFYRFDLNDLTKGERLGPHHLKLPHAMKRTASGKYICYGSMDNPRDGESRAVGIWNVENGEARRVELPATCWHLAVHRTLDVFYPVSFRVLPQEGTDWHEWAMAFFKEYAFEVDAESGEVLRHWTSGRETPAHINSDVIVSDNELIFCNGASQNVMMIDLESFGAWRMIDEKPDVSTSIKASRQIATQMYDVFARGSLFTSNRHFFGAMRVSRGVVLDSIYGTALSQDQSLLFTANRGLNRISVYDYPSNRLRQQISLPDLQEYVPWLSQYADPRLGLHHSYLIG
jgi:hypothetical protein